MANIRLVNFCNLFSSGCSFYIFIISYNLESIINSYDVYLFKNGFSYSFLRSKSFNY